MAVMAARCGREPPNKKPGWGGFNCWYTGWWFGTFFTFPNTWGDDPIWFSYFSEGLKPPTRYTMAVEIWILTPKSLSPGEFFCFILWWNYELEIHQDDEGVRWDWKMMGPGLPEIPLGLPLDPKRWAHAVRNGSSSSKFSMKLFEIIYIFHLLEWIDNIDILTPLRVDSYCWLIPAFFDCFCVLFFGWTLLQEHMSCN